MCSYKLVRAKFEVWGLQTKVEQWTHAVSIAAHKLTDFKIVCELMDKYLLFQL